MYMSKKKKNGYQWAIGWTYKEHTCNPLPDPFVVKEHRDKRPGHARAVQIAATHRGVIGYNNNNNNILLPGRSEAYAVISQSYLQAGQKHTKTLPLFAKRRAFSIP
jgi:hypothetical protein